MAGAGNNSGTKKEFDLGLFLDNFADYRKNVRDSCKNISTIDIDETPGDTFGLVVSYPSVYNTNTTNRAENVEGVLMAKDAARKYKDFLEGLSEKGKAAASILKKLLIRDGSMKESFDSRSGIQDGHVTQIKAWVNENKGKKLVVIFDFDRTLTMMEGGLFYGTSIQDWKERIKQTEKKQIFNKYYGYKQATTINGVPLFAYHWRRSSNGRIFQIPIPAGQNTRRFLDTFTAEGYAEYLAGSHKRLLMLQEMFDFLYENGVECFVLTNNTACKDSKGLLKELVEVFTKGRPIPILCGMDYDGKKGLAIQSHETLGSLCKQTGGKKTRRHKKVKRKTYKK